MFSGKKIAFHTLGCKLNFSETSAIARRVEKEGFAQVDFESDADVYVINTCSVTENADKECRYIVRKALRHSPDAQIVIIGCYAQLHPQEIASIKGVDLVLGAKEKFRLADYLKTLPVKKSLTEKGAVYSCDIHEVNLFESSYSFGARTRAFLKVQDGCDYSCTYCTIPLARGKSRSDSIAHVVDQANLLAELGVKEIVLTGVNIGDFGIQNPIEGKRAESFLGLIQQLDEVTGIHRFRISSIEPNLLKDEVIAFVAQSKRFMPHFHIPLQSGSDKILMRMKRRYLSCLYAERVEKINSLIPGCCIGADVITGFPGETEEEFMKSYHFLQELDISYLHVFTYSERDNTEASGMDGVVPVQIRNERNKMLRILSEKKRTAFYQKFIGEAKEVLLEGSIKNDFLEGFTDNYIKVRVLNEEKLRREITSINLRELAGDFVWGDVEETRQAAIFRNHVLIS